MAGGHVKFRHLSRDSSARQALLRGLVTQLVKHEHIRTTYAKAKEAQRMAEKLITLAKKDTERTRRGAQAMLYDPHLYLPKLFGPLRQRYMDRPGGYTRVLRTEAKDRLDQGASAILELVDGERDTRWAMTAMALARDRDEHRRTTELTQRNRDKITRYMTDGVEKLEQMVKWFRRARLDDAWHELPIDRVAGR